MAWTAEMDDEDRADDEDVSQMDEDEEDDYEAELAALNSAKGGEKRPAVYNAAGLHEKLEDISWPATATWLDTLVCPCKDGTVEEVDANDDLAREMAFYTQARTGACRVETRFRVEQC